MGSAYLVYIHTLRRLVCALGTLTRSVARSLGVGLRLARALRAEGHTSNPTHAVGGVWRTREGAVQAPQRVVEGVAVESPGVAVSGQMGS
jgi:hypothetical protein